MNNIDKIKDIIVDVFKARYKSDQLKSACKKYGMDIDDDVYSKADKIKSGLNKLSDQDIEKIAAKIEIDLFLLEMDINPVYLKYLKQASV